MNSYRIFITSSGEAPIMCYEGQYNSPANAVFGALRKRDYDLQPIFGGPPTEHDPACRVPSGGSWDTRCTCDWRERNRGRSLILYEAMKREDEARLQISVVTLDRKVPKKVHRV